MPFYSSSISANTEFIRKKICSTLVFLHQILIVLGDVYIFVMIRFVSHILYFLLILEAKCKGTPEAPFYKECKKKPQTVGENQVHPTF